MRDGAFGVGAPLNSCIDLPFVQLWNAQSTAEEARRLFDPQQENNNEPICSDADPELLFFIPLSSVCRLKGISIIGPASDYAPSNVKVFANPPEVRGFDSVRRLRPQEEIALAQVAADDRIVYRLNATKFAAVSALTLFFDHSFGEEETHLLRVELLGENLGRPTAQQVATNVVYEGRPNPADHAVEEEKREFFTIQ